MEARLKVEVTFVEPILGTMPGEPELVEEHILKKARNAHPDLPPEMEEEHLDSLVEVEEEAERQSTFFCRENGVPVLWDYMFRGFFKAACGALRRVKGTVSSKLTAYKKSINGLVFVYPRKIPLVLPKNSEATMLERPLRASGPKGERVCLARSEMLPAGTKCQIEILALDPELLDAIEEWLDYGKLCGIGQWRSGSYGRFEYSWLDEKPVKKKAKAQ